MRAGAVLLSGALLATGCSPNPRNEMPAIAQATLAAMSRRLHGTAACVERVIAPWQPPGGVPRIDGKLPAGFGTLLMPGVFRGGGGLKGGVVGGISVRAGPQCFVLHGPLIAGDRAMMEVHLPGSGWNEWLRRDEGGWRVVAETYSDYPI